MPETREATMDLKEKAIWAEVASRTGKKVLVDGERTRPLYLGVLINLNNDSLTGEAQDTKRVRCEP